MGSFDTSNLWLPRRAKVEYFQGNILDANIVNKSDNFISWTRPKYATQIMMICIGGAGGGGRGAASAAGTNRGGGAGGASAAIARAQYFCNELPATLFLLPGFGGLGSDATTGGLGSDGCCSTICDKVGNYGVLASTLLVSGVTGTGEAKGGQDGSGTEGFGRSGETISTNLRGAYQCLGPWVPKGGIDGQSGGNPGTAGTDTAAFGGTGIPLTEGAGGGSVNASNVAFAGGNITAGGRMRAIAGGAAGGATGGVGLPGISLNRPFFNTGGSGGGGGTTTGGRGGDGAIGCGGGGGGGGITGGNGGNGGPGLIILITW